MMRGRKSQVSVIRTPDQRLRVFVSSTLKELAREREATRQAILKLRLSPVMFESGARPHPPQKLYQAYLSQSHVFVGIYHQSYGVIAPDMQVSALEDEYDSSSGKPRLIYVKSPAPDREPALSRLLQRIKSENATCYKYFGTPDELRELVENDLVVLLTEYFERARGEEALPTEIPEEPPSNVPIPRNPLVGREQELATACDLLRSDDTGLVTLTGPAGTGKSRLGIQVALDLRGQFADGTYMVGLESVQDPDLVIPTIATALGITEAAGGPPLAESLKSHLRNKQLLLLLDNFEHVLGAAPQIAGLLEACPQAKILATSRASLHVRAERELPVPPLAVPPLKDRPELEPLSQYSAVQLFIQRAQSVRPGFHVTDQNAPAVAEICHRLDGLPLAIELASARIRTLSAQALLTRLGRRFEVLRGGMRDLPQRQRTLYGAIDWSYSLLDEDEKLLLRRLSVFVGGCTADAAEAVCSGEADERTEVFEGLERLVDSSILVPLDGIDGEPRFTMLESIREFAHEHLVGSAEVKAVRDRHAQYYLAFVERAETEMRRSAPQTWYRRLESEIDNLRSAMDWALRQEQNELVVRMATALWLFWETRGYWREGLQWLEKGLAGPGAIPDRVRAKALTRAGWLTHDLGDYPRAIAMLEESLALCRLTGDQAGLALTLSNLGSVVMQQADYPRATAMLEEALSLRRRLDDQTGTIATLLNLGLAAFNQGLSQRAVELYTESLSLARAADDEDHVVIILNNLGNVYNSQGDYDRAEGCYAEAVLLCQRLGNRMSAALISGNRGAIALKQGDYARAFELFSEAILAFREMGDKEHTLTCIQLLASMAVEQHRPDRAARLLGASDTLRKAIGAARRPAGQADFDACLADIRRQFANEDVFAAAWAEGSALTFEQAVAYAVDESGKPDKSSPRVAGPSLRRVARKPFLLE